MPAFTINAILLSKSQSVILPPSVSFVSFLRPSSPFSSRTLHLPFLSIPPLPPYLSSHLSPSFLPSSGLVGFDATRHFREEEIIVRNTFYGQIAEGVRDLWSGGKMPRGSDNEAPGGGGRPVGDGSMDACVCILCSLISFMTPA